MLCRGQEVGAPYEAPTVGFTAYASHACDRYFCFPHQYGWVEQVLPYLCIGMVLYQTIYTSTCEARCARLHWGGFTPQLPLTRFCWRCVNISHAPGTVGTILCRTHMKQFQKHRDHCADFVHMVYNTLERLSI